MNKKIYPAEPEETEIPVVEAEIVEEVPAEEAPVEEKQDNE